MDLGPHAGFIWMSYAAVGSVIGLLVVRLWLDGQHQARALAALERSTAPSSQAPTQL